MRQQKKKKDKANAVRNTQEQRLTWNDTQRGGGGEGV